MTLLVKLEENGLKPQIGKRGDAGIDLFADISCFYGVDSSAYIIKNTENGKTLLIDANRIYKIPLGFRYAFAETTNVGYHGQEHKIIYNHYLEIMNRSSIGTKNGFIPVAQICDASYRGIPHYCFYSTKKAEIYQGEKIAQGIIHPFLDPFTSHTIKVVDTLEELGITDRGDGGFGSTNKTI